MSHGGMGGGGGGGHGHCHGGHGGGHGAAFGMHADQSPSWNMAMQAERTELDLGKRLTITDPRVVIGVTLFVFVTLLSLPYTLDYLQSQSLADPDAPPAEESSGPSAAALAMVGTTLMGGHVEVPESALEKLGEAGHQPSQKKHVIEDRHTQARQAPAVPTLADQQEAASEAALQAYEAPAEAEKSANETVAAMLEASGMKRDAAPQAVANMPALPAMAPASADFGAPIQQQNPNQNNAPVLPQAPGLTMIEYGGAVRGPNQQYYVYIPNQHGTQANANFGQPLTIAAPAPMMQQQQPIAGASPRQLAMAMPQQGAAVAQRSAFNPDTSAIVLPLGNRHRAGAPTMPMLPSGPGQDGSQRMRVWVNR